MVISPLKKLSILLFLTTLFRLWLSQTIGFGVDESYMLAHAPTLSLSYFDHPPLHVWLAHFMQLIFGETSKWVRLPFVLLFSATSWFLYKITTKFYSPEAGFWACFALNMGFFFTVSAGMMVVPDGLLLFFLTLSTFILLSCDKNPLLWLVFGLTVGCAGLSKYHALFYGAGVFAYLWQMKKLNNPYVWLGAFIALLCQTPTILWNIEHNFVSFAMQSSRGSFKGLNITHFTQMIGGEILWLSPFVSIPLLYALYKEPRNLLLYWLGIPTVLFFTLTPLWGDRGLPHWTMSGWIFLLPFLGNWFIRTPFKKPFALACLSLLLGATALLIPHLKTGYLRPYLGKTDPALEAFDWPAPPLREAFILSGSWQEAGKLFIATQGKIPLYVFNKDKRHFAFHPSLPELLGKDALIISNRDISCLKPYFENLRETETLTFGRNSLKDFSFKTYRGEKLLKPLDHLCVE